MLTGYLTLYISGRRIRTRFFRSKTERRELMAEYSRRYRLGRGLFTSWFEVTEGNPETVDKTSNGDPAQQPASWPGKIYF